MVMSVEVVKELRFWRKDLRSLNSQRIRNMVGVQVVRPQLLYSDAGGHMAGGAMFGNKMVVGNTIFQINLTEAEVSQSATFRELKGIEEGLKALQAQIKGRHMRWHCDNWAVCKIVEFSSMKVDCHRIAMRINSLI